MSSAGIKKLLDKENVKTGEAFASLPPVDSDNTATVSPDSLPLQEDQRCSRGLKPLETAVMVVISVLLLAAAYGGWWSIGVAESWGFVTGGICVWLVVREHLWNWPVGLINNVFFFVLFLRGHLYADMSLQIVYLGLGIYGWLNWIFGGQNHAALKISRTTRNEWLVLAGTIPPGTWLMRNFLITVNDAAPFCDALTTVLSLAAQYLLCRKRFENWWFWIAADLIYVPLYISRQLPLTAVLYAVFLAMCLLGVREWSRSLKKGVLVP